MKDVWLIPWDLGGPIRIVTTNAKKSTGGEVAVFEQYKAKNLTVREYNQEEIFFYIFSSQISEKELSFRSYKTYSENREEVTISGMYTEKVKFNTISVRYETFVY